MGYAIANVRIGALNLAVSNRTLDIQLVLPLIDRTSARTGLDHRAALTDGVA
jgi:hypothetical protein